MTRFFFLLSILILFSCSRERVELKSFEPEKGWITHASPWLKDAMSEAPFDLVIKNQPQQIWDSISSHKQDLMLTEAFKQFSMKMMNDTTDSLSHILRTWITPKSYPLFTEGGREGMAFTSYQGNIMVIIFNPFLHERKWKIRVGKACIEVNLLPGKLHSIRIQLNKF